MNCRALYCHAVATVMITSINRGALCCERIHNIMEIIITHPYLIIKLSERLHIEQEARSLRANLKHQQGHQVLRLKRLQVPRWTSFK